jgi:pre-mRNA-processing factor 19
LYRTLIYQLTALTLVGHIFEKRLIEAYISENGKDPVTNEELTMDDLIKLNSAHIVRPRPPTMTSIPSLLSVFQNEWDALALETYTLRQHLTQTRQELSTTLYQHDAAVRVIARLTRERDEARDTLSKISVNGGVASNGDVMQIDGRELPNTLVAKVEATQEKYAAKSDGSCKPTRIS